MTTTTTTHDAPPADRCMAADSDDTTRPQHGRPGSEARLAALQHLAKYPQGASIGDLADVMTSATRTPFSVQRAGQVLISLRDDRLAARERIAGDWVWFSPAAREAAAARATPQHVPQRTATTTQAAAVVYTRGLSIDPNAD